VEELGLCDNYTPTEQQLGQAQGENKPSWFSEHKKELEVGLG
jgi:hypothetical protein